MMRVEDLRGRTFKVTYRFAKDKHTHTCYISANADVLGKINDMFDDRENWRRWTAIYNRAAVQAVRANVIRRWRSIDEKVVILSVEEVESF